MPRSAESGAQLVQVPAAAMLQDQTACLGLCQRLGPVVADAAAVAAVLQSGCSARGVAVDHQMCWLVGVYWGLAPG